MYYKLFYIVVLCSSFTLATQSQNFISHKNQDSVNRYIKKQHSKLDTLLSQGNNEHKVMIAYSRLAWAYLNQLGDYSSADKYNILADSLAQKLNDTIILAETKTIEGRILYRQGYFSSSLEAQRKALELKTLMKDTVRMSYSMRLMGMVFEAQKKYKKALEFYKAGISLKESINGAENATLYFLNISHCHLQLTELDNARIYAEKAIKTTKDSTRLAAKSLALMARIDLEEGNFSLALFNLIKAHHYITLKGPDLERAEIQSHLARALFLNGRVDDAYKAADEAYRLAIQNKHPEFAIRALNVIRDIEKRGKNYKEAYETTEKIRILKDSFYSREEMINSLDFDVLYKTRERQNQIRQLEQTQSVMKTQIKAREKEQQLMYAIIILLFTCLGAFFWLYIFSHKKKRQLALRDKIIEDQKLAQFNQEKRNLKLKSLIEGQEQERRRISRDIHDSLGGLLAAAKAHLSSNINGQKITSEIIDQACEEVREITHNLMPVSLTTTGLQGTIEDIKHKVEPLGIKCDVEIQLNKKERPDFDLNIYRIIQELVNNVVKHAKADRLLIQLIETSEEMKILVEDNGLGFKNNEPLKGMGFSNIQSRVDLLNGRLNIDSQLNEGTIVNIDIPTPS